MSPPAHTFIRPLALSVLAAWCVLLPVSHLRAATITIVNNDGPNEGLNDQTPVAPVGGNPGTTLGAQRLFAMEQASHIWGAKISSPVEILVRSNFDPLECSPSSGTLGAASAYTFFRDFVGAPRAGTYYPVALGSAFAGLDLDPANPDIVAVFNSSIGNGGCLASFNWYYGTDGKPPSGSFDFFETVLHEIAHGLGFVSLVNLDTGAKPNGFDDIFTLNLEDHSTGELFADMNDSERLAALENTGNAHWVGSQVIAQSGFLVSGRSAEGHVEMFAPSPVQGGSSLSHFSSSLSPDDLMEPFATDTSDRRLTEALFQDLGWTVNANAPIIALDATSIAQESCVTPNAAADPGEVVTMDVFLRNVGTGLTEDLQVTLLSTAGVVPLSTSQDYGILPATGQAVSRPFTLLAQGACGTVVNATFHLQDGTNDLGTLDVPIQLGLIPSASQDLSNTASIAIPASSKSGPASPYPSTLQVNGFTSTVSRVTITLHDLDHQFPDNIDIVLEGPGGQKVLILSDVGGGTEAHGVTLVLDDDADAAVPDAGPLVSGSFRPTNIGGGDTLPSPAPSAPFADVLSVFSGVDPNGDWRLFINDDSNPNSGVLQGGWTLTLYSDLPPVCCEAAEWSTDLAVYASTLANPVNAASTVPLTLTVTNEGPDIAIAVSLTNILSGDATLDVMNPSQGFCELTPEGFACQLGNLDPGAFATVSITLLMGATGPIQLDAEAFTISTDPVPANNQATAATLVNSQPTISGPLTLALDEDSPSGPLDFLVDDLETPLPNLNVTARSSNTNLLPDAGLLLSGSGRTRTLNFTPAPEQSGTAAIIVTVDDGLSTANALLIATVNAVNDSPVLSAIPDQNAYAGQLLQTTAFASDLDSTNLQFELISAPPGGAIDALSGIITWTPAPAEEGTTNLFSVRVSDDGSPSLEDTQSFTVRVLPLDPPVLQSITVSGGVVTLVWTTLPGAAYRVQYRALVEDPGWTDLGGDIVAAGTTANASDLDGAPARFYQILLVSPPAP